MTEETGLKARREAGRWIGLRRLAAALLAAAIASPEHEASAGTFAAAPSDQLGYYKMTFTGSIAPGDVFALQKHMAEIPAAVRNTITKRKVYLDSKGGDLEVGIALGRYFRENEIRTEVARGATCESACALAFLGGTTETSRIALRTKSSSATLGFHAFRLDSDAASFDRKFVERALSKSQRLMLDLVKYFLEVDGDPELLDRIVSTAPEGIYYLSNDEAMRYCIFVDEEQPDGAKILFNPYELRYAQPTPPRSDVWKRSRCKYP